MNVNKLKGAIVGAGMSQYVVADRIGISQSRFNAKVNEAPNAWFTLRELLALKELLGLNADQMDEIFFR